METKTSKAKKVYFYYYLIITVLTLGVCFGAVSDRSLWVDEGYSALNTLEPDHSKWKERFLSDLSLDPLKPLHGVYLRFASLYVTGNSELGMRIQNLLWLLLSVFFLLRVERRVGLIGVTALFLVHPFLWYYLDEVRPYAMQIAGGVLLLEGITQIIYSTRLKTLSCALFWLGALLLSGSSLLGGILVVAAVLSLVVWSYFRWPVQASQKAIVANVTGFSIQLLLLIYYIVMFFKFEQEGGAASKQWGIDLKNLLFAAYEFMGGMGIGPEREGLRSSIKAYGIAHSLKLFIPYSVALAVAGFCACYLSYVTLRWLPLFRYKSGFIRLNKGLLKVLSSIIFITIAGLFMGAFLFQWPFWGRHLSGLLAIVLLAAFILFYYESRVKKYLIFIVAFLLFTYGSLNYRINYTELREDYRSATALALEVLDSDQTVFWLAASQPAEFYGLMGETAKSNTDKLLTAKEIKNNELTLSQQSNMPDFVFISRPDITDPGGVFQKKFIDAGYGRKGGISGFILFTKNESISSEAELKTEN